MQGLRTLALLLVLASACAPAQDAARARPDPTAPSRPRSPLQSAAGLEAYPRAGPYPRRRRPRRAGTVAGGPGPGLPRPARPLHGGCRRGLTPEHAHARLAPFG